MLVDAFVSIHSHSGDEPMSPRARNAFLRFALVAAFFFHAPGFAATISYSVEGQPAKTVTMEELVRLLPIAQMQVRNPENGQHITYEGFAFADVLRTVAGADWTQFKTIEFGCTDGYRPTMPVKAATAHRGLLAIREPGKPALGMLQRTNGGPVELGRFYLVWENIQDSAAATNTELSWPWQLESIALHTR